MKVAVCTLTYLRPHGLKRLLLGLDRLTFEASPAPELEVVVVDNDPEGSAESVCEALRSRIRWPLRYHREPTRGISFARNAAVNAARDRADFIAFIDDDEVPEPTWLDELLRVQRRYDADVVSGPVVRSFESEVEPWVVRGRFFEDPRFETGERVEHPATNNVLIRAGVFEGMEEPFDPRFALAGGEDTHFFLRLARDGRRMVWADEALVREWVPGSRARAKWILQRAFRRGNTWSICERELRPSGRVLGLRVAKGAARIGYGVLMLPPSLVLGRHALVKSLQYMWFGAGNLAGLMGLRYQEYKVIHGK
jgi:succinoglycan biosynthesis protein ExoM